jgi:hypothetical protein
LDDERHGRETRIRAGNAGLFAGFGPEVFVGS